MTDENESPLHGIEFDSFGVPTLSERWTPAERLAAVSFLVSVIADDVSAGRYSDFGRPNSMAVQYICALPADALEAGGARESIEKYAKERRARWDCRE